MDLWVNLLAGMKADHLVPRKAVKMAVPMVGYLVASLTALLVDQMVVGKVVGKVERMAASWVDL